MSNDYFVRDRLTPKVKTATEIREQLKKDFQHKKSLSFVGVTQAIEAIIIERQAIELSKPTGLYLSGAGLSTSLGLPDIGVMSLEQLAYAVKAITDVTNLPLLVDIDTGYGDVCGAIKVLEAAGASMVHIEDQLFPKRCGHLDGKDLVSSDEMCEKIKQAVKARCDSNFMIMARSDARAVEGFEGMISRLKAYHEAGADTLFPEAMTSLDDFKKVKDVFADIPLLANLTENGKTPLGLEESLKALGYGVLLYPVSLMRMHMQMVEDKIKTVLTSGNLELEQDVMARKKCMSYLLYDLYVEQDSKNK